MRDIETQDAERGREGSISELIARQPLRRLTPQEEAERQRPSQTLPEQGQRTDGLEVWE